VRLALTLAGRHVRDLLGERKLPVEPCNGQTI
jgi:hypothetical protein